MVRMLVMRGKLLLLLLFIAVYWRKVCIYALFYVNVSCNPRSTETELNFLSFPSCVLLTIHFMISMNDLNLKLPGTLYDGAVFNSYRQTPLDKTNRCDTLVIVFD